ncbi:hypothetical protein PR202_ga09344 [Eleusine coracana subsp. coracana]|uniref:Uncharacterized protein n=1 Tax=Eleusine coracana subsp. coracana TaxID=191504 RepID=A0AAV5C4G7_ELECO|nr:hypothetical protein PR202_ga09344 [Eleusine coracana subsp. coracana]
MRSTEYRVHNSSTDRCKLPFPVCGKGITDGDEPEQQDLSEVVVSETWWPSGGGGLGASVGNAAAYMNNVVRHVGTGTPRPCSTRTRSPRTSSRTSASSGPDMTEAYHVDFATAAAS